MDNQSLHDHQSITTVVTGVVHNIDRRKWPELRALYSDVVETDYRSLFGGEVQTQNADSLVEGWRKLLTPLDATQHLLGPVEVEIEGNQATASCHVRAYHLLNNAPGGQEWMVAGHYVLGLVKTSSKWQIRTMKLETFYQTGNKKLLEEAAKK